MFTLARKDQVNILRMEHKKANALDLELCQSLTESMVTLAEDESGALVITGTGRIFSAGVDLLRILDGGQTYIRAFIPALIDCLEAFFRFPKPMVAAINGHAIAGGCVLACAADLRLMAHGKGRMAVPELLVGVVFPTAALEIMRAATAPSLLGPMIYRGLSLDCELALSRELVAEVLDESMLDDRALTEAKAFAALPREAFAFTKRQMRQPFLDRIEAAKAHKKSQVLEIWENPETIARIRAYVEQTLRKA